MLTLAARSALVTGGSRGIGRAVCELLGRLGARVAVNYSADEAAGRAVAEAVRASGPDSVALKADASRPEEVERLLAEAELRLGPLDVVVVNHGIWKRAPIDTMTVEQWHETIDTNLGGAYAICHHAARRMMGRRRGSIVIIASTAGQRGEAFHAHYAATKGALIAFTKSLATELASHGIRVNGVAPGWVLTDMSRPVLLGSGAAAALGPIPLGRAGRPEEIAGAVAFLASDLASYLYGEVLCVNGGAVMVS